jgi:hypothetical protein
MPVKNRARGAKSKARPTSKISADKRYPQLLKYWDSEANGSMKDFTGTVQKLIPWECLDNTCYRYLLCLIRMNHKAKCFAGYACCAVGTDKQVCLSDACNLLLVARSQFEKYWTSSNGDMKSFTVSSNVKVSWQCGLDPQHAWQQKISDAARSTSMKCQHCRSLAGMSPQILAERDYEVSGDPKDYANASHAKVPWNCLEEPHHI